jgi:dihydrofolate reductase
MISLIWAMDENQLIGKNQDLPWYYPEDLKYFKALTLNKTIVMGRATYDSIIRRNGKKLPKRHHVVLSHRSVEDSEVEVINDLEKYLDIHHDEDIYIIGGKTVFEKAFPYADRLYITHIHQIYEGDIYLAPIDLNDFNLITKIDQTDLSFCVYERKS